MPLITPAVAAIGVPRVLYVNVTPQSNAYSGGLEDLMAYTVPSGLLGNNGDMLRVSTVFKLLTALDISFGFTVDGVDVFLSDYPTFAFNTGIVQLDFTVVRKNVTTLMAFGRVHCHSIDSDAYGERSYGLQLDDYVVPSLDTASFDLTSQAQGATAANQVQQLLMQVVYEPAP